MALTVFLFIQFVLTKVPVGSPGVGMGNYGLVAGLLIEVLLLPGLYVEQESPA